MPAVVRLDACPLCRTTLRGGEDRCPGCGTDLQPYLDSAHRASELLALARELLSRGEHERAAALLPLASRLTSLDAAQLAELEGRIALARGDTAQVQAAAEKLSSPTGAALQAELDMAFSRGRQARELYNHGLTEARQGLYSAAAERLHYAVHLDAANPRLWQLKLKCDLKAGLLYRCYEDLEALDRLRARPLGFARLEALLPPSLPH